MTSHQIIGRITIGIAIASGIAFVVFVETNTNINLNGFIIGRELFLIIAVISFIFYMSNNIDRDRVERFERSLLPRRQGDDDHHLE